MLVIYEKQFPPLCISAFDMVHDPAVAVETLVSLGFERILTSGCDGSALEGLPVIKRLVEQVSKTTYLINFNKRIDKKIPDMILPGFYEVSFFSLSYRWSQFSPLDWNPGEFSLAYRPKVPAREVRCSQSVSKCHVFALRKQCLEVAGNISFQHTSC